MSCLCTFNNSCIAIHIYVTVVDHLENHILIFIEQQVVNKLYLHVLYSVGYTVFSSSVLTVSSANMFIFHFNFSCFSRAYIQYTLLGHVILLKLLPNMEGATFVIILLENFKVHYEDIQVLQLLNFYFSSHSFHHKIFFFSNHLFFIP